MENFEKIKNILQAIDLDKYQQTIVQEALMNLEMDIEELVFANKKFQKDLKINKNFVKKTILLLEESNNKLKQSNDELIDTNNKLINSNMNLERFAHTVSHDLKSPLNNMIQFSEIIEKKIHDKDDQFLKECLSFVISGGKRMRKLIDDILEYSKVSKDQTSNNEKLLKPKEILKDITVLISNKIKEKNAKIKITSPLPHFIYNQSSIFILFKNLIENAIKYNEAPSPLIKIYSKKEQNKQFIFFEDNGIGIEKKNCERIFQMFTRLHGMSRYEGSGIGLATCKKIVEDFGGKITVSSQLNKGSLFKIWIPQQLLVSSKNTLM